MIYENSMQNGCFWMYNELMGNFFKVKVKHNANCKRIREAGHEHEHWIYDTQQNIEWFGGKHTWSMKWKHFAISGSPL